MKNLKDENKLAEIINYYDPTEDHSMWGLLIELENKIEKKDIIVPFIGTQGMGKSTLINALLGEDILPNEADETTCIPVEVRYGETCAEVHFKDGTKTYVRFDKNELAQYVDNNFNCANEKGVSRILLKKEYSVLKDGTVIVDLPGVGSLTRENEKTTREYIEKLCAAVFLIPTSPPILSTQANFIKAVWRGINTAFFVQNVWVDNSKKEIDEGVAYNQKILKQISSDIGTEYSNDIIPVNIYNAAKGKFDSNEKMIRESNILDLVNALNKFAKNYSEITEKNYFDRIEKALSIIVSEIEKQIHQSTMTKDELLSELKEERENFQNTSDEIEKIIRDIKNLIDDHEKDARSFAEKIAKTKSELLRSELYHLIEGGVVDGNQLTDAFTDYQVEYGAEACDEAYEELCRVSEDLSKKFLELQSIVDKEILESPEVEQFYKEQQLKWEKGVQIGIDIAGVIGGGILGDIVAGAIGGSVGGPVGAVVGIAVAIFGGFLGGKVRKTVQNQRADETKDEIEPSIKEFKANIKDAINNSFKKYFSSLEVLVNDYKNSREAYLEEINMRIASIISNGNDIQSTVEKMNGDLDFIKNWRL